MPIEQLICRSCLSKVEASGLHWLGECDDPTVHPGLVQAYLDSDEQRRTLMSDRLGLEPTRVIGKVRDAFIQATMPYSPEAQGFSSPSMGAAIAAPIEEAMVRKGWYRQVLVTGEFWGFPFRGIADLVAPDYSEIWDNKVGSEGSFLWAKSRGYISSEENAAQVSMYARMMPTDSALAKLWLKRWKEWPDEPFTLRVWHGAIRAAYDRKTRQPIDSWHPTRAPLMTEDQIGSLHPFGSLTTVRENAEILASAFRRVQLGEDPSIVLMDVPKACEPCFNQTACRYYCGSNRVCLTSNEQRLKGIAVIT